MAQEMALINRAEITTHARFGTATIRWGSRRADAATARAETYARYGALPTIKPGTIAADLARRDFTINAMAIELNPPHFGELIDLHGGQQGVEKD
jgi:tRNA nucleotidyltransferase (CCA-adding enzyme)